MAIRIMDSIKTANDTTDFPVSYAKDIWLNKDKTGATADYSDLQTMYNNDELGNGGSSIQVDTMPIASVDELGKIYEFIGSTGTYVNGYFYECVSDGEPTPTYSWVQKNVQPNSVTLTQEEYEALPEEQKLDGLYYTYDTKRIYKNGVQYGASDAEGIGYNNAESGIQATTVQGAIDKVVKTSGIADRMLIKNSIGRNMSWSELENAMTVTYFTNWDDSTHFPNLYGSGVLIPGLDVNNKYIIYIDDNNTEYINVKTVNSWSTWKELATMDKVNALHKQTVGYIEGDLLSSAIESANLYYQKFGDSKLVINGWISLGSAVPTQGTKLFTLPNGWKTDSNYLLPCYTPNSNSAYACMIDISTSDVKSYTPLPSGVELRFCADIYLA